MEKPKRPLSPYEEFLLETLEIKEELIEGLIEENLNLKEKLNSYTINNIEIKPIIKSISNRKE